MQVEGMAGMRPVKGYVLDAAKLGCNRQLLYRHHQELCWEQQSVMQRMHFTKETMHCLCDTAAILEPGVTTRACLLDEGQSLRTLLPIIPPSNTPSSVQRSDRREDCSEIPQSCLCVSEPPKIEVTVRTC